MLTLFTTPKPFSGEFRALQRDGLSSWTRLRPRCEILLFGDEEGAAEAAADLGLRHVPDVQRNEFGMPLVASLFHQAQRLATGSWLAYVNADILLMDDFVDAVQRAAAWSDRFLLIGQRYNVPRQIPVSVGPDWADAFRRDVIAAGFTLSCGMDYFAYPSALWDEIPPSLAVGRAGWDNWPIYEARLQKAAVIDATSEIMAVHQPHGYSNHPQGRAGVYDGVEVERNFDTLGGRQNQLTMLDATHVLTAEGLRLRCRSCHPMCVCRPQTF